ncbi:hypothetical protein ACFSQT_14835 [Mesorhizobium calcicola]|uniref:Uncharacterized protein n=1 Tax=Mesorhizobium calcicola TaxID=1300310 RepID=A0ABW4WEL7_9HYPH
MSRSFFLLMLAATCLSSQPVHAGGTDRALDAFHRTCVAQGPDFERTMTLAKTRGWAPLSGDAALAPVDEMTAFQAWQTVGEDLPAGAMVAVAKGTMDGRAVQICSVKLLDVDRAEFEKRFFERTDAEKIGEARKGKQLSRLYLLIASNRRQMVHLTSSAVEGIPNILIASSIVDK